MEHLDGELPQSEIFKDLTLKLLEVTAHSLIINAAIASQRPDDKPSWVVDWTRSPPNEPRWITDASHRALRDTNAMVQRLDFQFDSLNPRIVRLRGHNSYRGRELNPQILFYKGAWFRRKEVNDRAKHSDISGDA